jgi:hypothetical protein
LQLEKELQPPSWKGYSDPVTPIEGSLYGLPRAGHEWGTKAKKFMQSKNYTQVVDTGEESIWLKQFPESKYPVLIILYVDDFEISGVYKLARLVLSEIRAGLGMAHKSNYELNDFIGLE